MVASPALAASHCCHAVVDKKLASSQGPKKLVFPPAWPRIRLSWHMPKSPKFKIFFLWKLPKKLENEPKSPKLGNHEKMTSLTSWVSRVYEPFQKGLHTTEPPFASHEEYDVCKLAALKWSLQSTYKWTSALKDGHMSTEMLGLTRVNLYCSATASTQHSWNNSNNP